MKINTFGSEVSWQGAGKITTGTFEIFYTGGREHERGTTIIQDQDMGKTIEYAVRSNFTFKNCRKIIAP